MTDAPIESRGPAPTELVAVSKAYDLTREMTARVAKYPRSHRFVLGDRTLVTTHEVLEQLLEAKYARDKVPLLDRANVLLERLRFQVRLAHDEKLISTASTLRVMAASRVRRRRAGAAAGPCSSRSTASRWT